MRLSLLTTIFFLNACSTVPNPPSVETCIIGISKPFESSYAVCVPSAKSIAREHVDSQDGTHYIPLSTMDNYISFSPDDWGKIEGYILQLKTIINNQ